MVYWIIAGILMVILVVAIALIGISIHKMLDEEKKEEEEAKKKSKKIKGELSQKCKLPYLPFSIFRPRKRGRLQRFSWKAAHS